MWIKCQMCGGEINFSTHLPYGKCEYCGSVMTFPHTNDERILQLFNRATSLRQQHEYDKAEAVYDLILNEQSDNAEAHWGVFLCRYGVEYVLDGASNNRIPTCQRTQSTPALNDQNYLAALQFANDESTRSIYRFEAQKIAKIQKESLEIAEKEHAYDIFICYKELTRTGVRTKESVLAQDLYERLTERKYRVFLSRISLEDKIGSEYEPYIFSALQSAKVMLVIGTQIDNFNAAWVKNEWSRFLALTKDNRSKVLIPCYRDMNTSDLPQEFSLLQAQDMGKIGFYQDLFRGIEKVFAANSAAKIATATPPKLKVAIKEPLLPVKADMAASFPEQKKPTKRSLTTVLIALLSVFCVLLLILVAFVFLRYPVVADLKASVAKDIILVTPTPMVSATPEQPIEEASLMKISPTPEPGSLTTAAPSPTPELTQKSEPVSMTERLLSDEEIASLSSESANKMRKSISRPADAIALLNACITRGRFANIIDGSAAVAPGSIVYSCQSGETCLASANYIDPKDFNFMTAYLLDDDFDAGVIMGIPAGGPCVAICYIYSGGVYQLFNVASQVQHGRVAQFQFKDANVQSLQEYVDNLPNKSVYRILFSLPGGLGVSYTDYATYVSIDSASAIIYWSAEDDK